MKSSTETQISHKRRVLFVAWFLKPERRWLGEYLDPERYECAYVGLDKSVDITSKRTTLRKWLAYFELALKARRKLASERYDLVVTSFPQVGFAFALVQWLTFQRTPHVVWYFNLGHAYQGMMQKLSRLAFRQVRRFIVYTEAERASYAAIFALPRERFHFTYLTGAPLDKPDYQGTGAKYELPERYIAALGSSSRDYATLFKAVAGLKTQVIVVTHRYSIAGLKIPANVRIIESIPQQDYLGLLADATICVIPVNNVQTASGQMTLIQAMALGTPIIATRCIGTEDYIQDGTTGIFVPMGDADAMRDAIETVLCDEPLRQRLIANARDFAHEHLFESAGSRVLDRLYDELAHSGEVAEAASQPALQN